MGMRKPHMGLDFTILTYGSRDTAHAQPPNWRDPLYSQNTDIWYCPYRKLQNKSAKKFSI